MTENRGDDTIKDPEDWTTGDEPATGAQLSYLGTLAREAGRDLPEDLTKAQASSLIDELRGQSERVAGDDETNGGSTDR
ncbi:DUF3072 domain-containing protein [Georgenia sp. TF02-10]|uniref:DUF3072 domain-containing protein n=1 Tax=Georgenia sp. TF02-10 TaxID=2917725 RepID=UPI001FA6D42F|nr:DUF3072 domain-containing protein [Georgenia sp. TF02-10]UNX54173.1 DUF3072 domain-containing protein [Georgenia sp. TF02-10]